MGTSVPEIDGFLIEKVQEALKEKGMEVTEVDSNFDLFQSGAFDSMGFVSLITSIESRFGIEMDFSDLEPDQFTKLGGLGMVVAKSLSEQP